MDIGPAELAIVLLIALLIFGGSKLPKLARSMGQATHEFKKGFHLGADEDDDAPEAPEAPNTAVAAVEAADDAPSDITPVEAAPEA